MKLTVTDSDAYCYTGGKDFDPAKPTVVFIHGVLNDHSVWILQSRYMAHHGWNVLAVDLPGHCRSGGEAPATVEEAADFIAALLDAAGVQKAALVGHSWGSLIALEAASRLKERVSHLVLVGTAYPMKVSPTLIEVNVFHRGFKACDSYANGEVAITQITCPVLFVLGEQDQMTQARAAKGLIATAKSAGKSVQICSLPVGHHQMTETPDETLFAIRDFLAT